MHRAVSGAAARSRSRTATRSHDPCAVTACGRGCCSIAPSLARPRDAHNVAPQVSIAARAGISSNREKNSMPTRRNVLQVAAALIGIALAGGASLALAQGKLKVAAVYTVPVEQQWVSRIHKALN